MGTAPALLMQIKTSKTAQGFGVELLRAISSEFCSSRKEKQKTLPATTNSTAQAGRYERS